MLLCYHYLESAYIFLLIFLYVLCFLHCHGIDIAIAYCSICHWNLNSITIHNFSKLTQLKAYISTYKHDFICLSETSLDSSIPDNLIDIKGYNLVRADHLDNIKRGEVFIYYKESLSLRIRTLPYFKETLFLELIHNNNKVIVVICRSPSQINCELDSFLTNFEHLLSEINKCKLSFANFNIKMPILWKDQNCYC